jgi:hypothetical protein
MSVKSGRIHSLWPELEEICGGMAALDTQWVRCVRFFILRYEETYHRRDIQPWLASWLTLAQNASLSGHTLILEEGPKMGIEAAMSQSEDGCDVFEGMCAPGRKQARVAEGQARQLQEQGRVGALATVSGAG